jgi:hypothetical protein
MSNHVSLGAVVANLGTIASLFGPNAGIIDTTDSGAAGSDPGRGVDLGQMEVRTDSRGRNDLRPDAVEDRGLTL